MTFPPIPESDLADRLRETMERNEHSVEDLSFITGVSTPTISRLRNGNYVFRKATLRIACDYIRNYSQPAPKPLEPCAWIPKPLLTH